MIRTGIVYMVVIISVLSFPYVGRAEEEGIVSDIFAFEYKESAEERVQEELPPPSKAIPERTSQNTCKSLLEEYRNTSVWQFYIGLRGGGAVTGTYGELTNKSRNYVGLGGHPIMGGMFGLGIQTTPNFTFRIGVGVDHYFKTSRLITSIDTKDSQLINSDTQKVEKTSILGEMYFDFHSGLWSSFFLKLAGGYSWVTVDGIREQAPTAGFGLGVRWYAHKYLTFDWTILEAKATFLKNISGELGTQVGITFQY